MTSTKHRNEPIKNINLNLRDRFKSDWGSRGEGRNPSGKINYQIY